VSFLAGFLLGLIVRAWLGVREPEVELESEPEPIAEALWTTPRRCEERVHPEPSI